MSSQKTHYTCHLLADYFASTGLRLYAVEPLAAERAILSYPSPPTGAARRVIIHPGKLLHWLLRYHSRRDWRARLARLLEAKPAYTAPLRQAELPLGSTAPRLSMAPGE